MLTIAPIILPSTIHVAPKLMTTSRFLPSHYSVYWQKIVGSCIREPTYVKVVHNKQFFAWVMKPSPSVKVVIRYISFISIQYFILSYESEKSAQQQRIIIIFCLHSKNFPILNQLNTKNHAHAL